MNTTNKKIESVKKMMSLLAGIPVDFTIRGENKFTFHYEGKNEKAMNKLINYFSKANVKIETEYDVELNYSCLFIN